MAGQGEELDFVKGRVESELSRLPDAFVLSYEDCRRIVPVTISARKKVEDGRLEQRLAVDFAKRKLALLTDVQAGLSGIEKGRRDSPLIFLADYGIVPYKETSETKVAEAVGDALSRVGVNSQGGESNGLSYIPLQGEVVDTVVEDFFHPRLALRYLLACMPPGVYRIYRDLPVTVVKEYYPSTIGLFLWPATLEMARRFCSDRGFPLYRDSAVWRRELAPLGDPDEI